MSCHGLTAPSDSETATGWPPQEHPQVEPACPKTAKRRAASIAAPSVGGGAVPETRIRAASERGEREEGACKRCAGALAHLPRCPLVR
eukprot:7080574-Prymnesium_polylepis.1